MTAGSSRRDPAAWCLCPRATTPGLSATTTSCSSTGMAQRTTQSRPPPPDRSFKPRAPVAFPWPWGLLVVHHVTMAGWRGRITTAESWEHREASLIRLEAVSDFAKSSPSELRPRGPPRSKRRGRGRGRGRTRRTSCVVSAWLGRVGLGRLNRCIPPDVIGAGPESLSPDYVTGVGGCDDRIVPGVDAVVVDVPGGVVEEDHVARLLLVLRNVPADGVLVDGVVRQPHPEAAEDDHDQAGAVEGVGTGAAPLVGGAVVRGGLAHDRIAETLGARR